MRIYESAEDYLEAILMLRERTGWVRSVCWNITRSRPPSSARTLRQRRLTLR